MAKTTTNEEGMGPMERGRLRYSKGKYDEALEAFTEAVDCSSQHLLLNALDARAGTHLKLDDIQSALRDSKKMIELMPKRGKGYLRCGQVLRVMKKPELALRIYERGLEKVKIGGDNDRTKLQATFNEIKKAQAPTKSRDPLEFLPLELAQMVVLNLEMRDRVICLAVTHSWKKLLESSHKLWTTLDTSGVNKLLSERSLKIYFRRSKFTVDRAILDLKSVDSQRLRWIFQTCKHLKELQMQGRGLLGFSLTKALEKAKGLEILAVSYNTQINLTTVQEAVKHCKDTLVSITFLNIQGLPFSGFYRDKWVKMDSVKTLHLRGNGPNSTPALDINGIRDATPNAVSVTLNGWVFVQQTGDTFDATPWTQLQYLDLSNTQLKHLPKMPSTLKHLNLSGNTQLHVGDDEEEMPTLMPFLETFNCESTNISPAALRVLTEPSIHKGNLKTLLIGKRIAEHRSTPVIDEYPAADAVEELSLSHMQINDTRMLQIIELYPILKKLDVSGTKITGVAVRRFVDKGMKQLNLNECVDISQDAIDWARSQGVEVTFSTGAVAVAGSRRSFWNSSFARSFA